MGEALGITEAIGDGLGSSVGMGSADGLGSAYDPSKAGAKTLTIWWLGNQELPGIEDKTVVWAWSLDVVVVALSGEAPSGEVPRKSAA